VPVVHSAKARAIVALSHPELQTEKVAPNAREGIVSIHAPARGATVTIQIAKFNKKFSYIPRTLHFSHPASIQFSKSITKSKYY
jgi:hypothetical protein